MSPGELVHALFVPQDAALRQALARTETFVRDELGDARGFSLDSPRSRAPKLQAPQTAIQAVRTQAVHEG